MQKSKMYFERPKNGNIPVMRYCAFACIYCNFRRFLKLSPCEQCRKNENHSHLEVLLRTPPKTAPGQFLTVGLSGDISFMPVEEFYQVIEYCRKWKDRTFLIQSKNPAYFLRFQEHIMPLRIPDNVILGTTIESNLSAMQSSEPSHKVVAYNEISQAPYPCDRIEAMKKTTCRKAITIEPILRFNLGEFVLQIEQIAPELEFVYIGYANDRHEGKKLKLPEPPLEKTMQLIEGLRNARIEVREKTLRKAWYEE